MKLPFGIYLIFLIAISCSCKRVAFYSLCNRYPLLERHAKRKVNLEDYKDPNEVIYSTPLADFHFSRTAVETYAKDKITTVNRRLESSQIINYLLNHPENPVVIPDTLGTCWDTDILWENDSLTRVRDQDHPHAWVTDGMRWMTLKFAPKGAIES